MGQELKVMLSYGCRIEVNLWDWGPEASVIYTERSPDAWYSDTETDCPIEPEQAQAIIDALQAYLAAKNQPKG